MSETPAVTPNRLADRGILFLTGDINMDSCMKVANSILQMNLEQNQEFIQLMISSRGGDVNAGFALIDLMNWSSLPIYTTGFGLVASMGLSILIAGEKGHRVITPHATLMAHRFWTVSHGNYSDMVAKRKMEDLVHQRIVDHYLESSRLKTKEEVERLFLKDVDTWITPTEALEFGLIDQVHESVRRDFPSMESRVETK